MARTAEEKVHQVLLQRVRTCEIGKSQFIPEWQRNVAFLQNRQWVMWNGSQWVDMPIPKWMSAITLNFMQPIAFVTIAKLTANRPQWEVMPWTDEEDDKMQARGTEALLEHLWDSMNIRAKSARAVYWNLVAGFCGFGVYWQPHDGYTTEEEEFEDAEVVDLDTERKKRRKIIDHGKPVTNVISPFDLGIDPYAEDDEDIGWLYRIRWVHKSWLKKWLHKRAKESEKGAPLSGFGSKWEGVVDGEDGNDPDDWLVVYEMYSRHDKRMWLFTLDRILHTEEWLTDCPIVLFRMFDRLGDLKGNRVAGNALLGTPLMSALVPIQMEINKTASQILQYKDHTIYPRWLSQEAHDLDISEISRRPHTQITYKNVGGPAPREVQVRPLPAYVVNLVRDFKQHMEDIAGIHDITQGQAPGSIQTGRGVAILAEMDERRWGPPATNLTDALSKIGTLTVRAWKARAPEKLTVRLIGKNNAFEAFVIHRASMISENIRVAPGSTFAFSKGLKNDQIKELWQMGLLTDPSRALRAMEMGALEEVVGDNTKARNRARRENFLMYRGDQPKMEQWDDHVAHMDQILEVTTSELWDRLEEPVQEIFRAHWMEHYQAYQATMQQQQMDAGARGAAASASMGQEAGAPAQGQTPEQGMAPGALG